ncbi:hypothetical protein SAMN04488503_3122 [Humidesulfovibrio mexicanus]|uniref:Tlde1 domain-containing protein n=1 Tax=Humidesulfovibrio mexicanus TaxID=147047 RepID=A0A239CGL3_9BACT|nr:tlde1 domain-containing protein [Humidesulfovibrio mexicanus]SNS19376.1 hypothetical protein SAMN04488503_3122 [Humidesulfovibrio mexicanus]
METRSTDNRIWTWVSDDGKHAAAGMSLGPVGMKPGGGGEEQPYNGLGQYLGKAGPDGISGGSEVRGKATPPPKPKYPPPPPAPREPHLVYSIESHTLRNPEGGVMTDDAYSGKGQHRNKAASQDIENFGPIPEGNWRVQEITDPKYCKEHHLTPPVFRLVPDEETEKRVGKDGMGRKPKTFLVHGDRPDRNASQGCIILNKPARERLRNYEGEWIRVTK